jgi:hypothetical protein
VPNRFHACTLLWPALLSHDAVEHPGIGAVFTKESRIAGACVRCFRPVATTRNVGAAGEGLPWALHDET